MIATSLLAAMTLGGFPFPAVNASLNGLSAVLLFVGHALILRRQVRAHATLMIAAVCTSTLFLASYLTYHYVRYATHGVMTRFPSGTIWRPIYLAILSSHTLLAVVIVPLVIVTLVYAAKRRFDKHRRIARWTYWLWLYVSVTGVIIYLMLYHLAPMLAHTPSAT